MRIKLTVLCLLFAPLIGEAKPKPPPDKNREQAAEIFVKAESAYKLQQFEEALKGFQEAYALTSEDSLLFNIAQCYRQLGRLEEAKKSYQTFLRDVPKSPLRANAEERIKDLEAEMARLAQKGTAMISAQQDPTQVFFDGEAKGDSPLSLKELEPGEHRITAKKEGFIDFEVVATIKPGETYELKVPQLMAVVTQQEIQEQTQHRVYFFGAAGLGGLGIASFVGSKLFLHKAFVLQQNLTPPDDNGDGISSAKEIGTKQSNLEANLKNSILFGRIALGLAVGTAASAGIGLLQKSKANKKNNAAPKSEAAEVQP